MLKALNNYILIEPEKKGEHTLDSGIVVPELKSDIPQTGTVVSIPDNCDVPYKEGDRVWFKMWAGEEIKHGGKDLKFVHFKDVFGHEQGGESK